MDSIADPTVALQVKPPSTQDIVAPLTAYANMQLAGARTKEIGLQARQADATYGARQNYLSMINSGTAPEDAVVKSGLSAIDPAGADQALKNVQQGREIGAVRNYDPNNPASVAAGGPEMVGKAATALGTQATTAETRTKTAQTQAELMGQHGNAYLANPTVDNWNTQVQSAYDHGLISFAQAQDNWGKPNAAIAKAWAAGGQTPQQYAVTSGQQTGNEEAAKLPYTFKTVEPGQSVWAGSAITGAPAGATPAWQQGAPQGQPASTAAPASGPASSAPPASAAPPQQGRSVAAPSAAAPLFAAIGAKYGVSPDYLARSHQIESGGNWNAVNPGSNAAGGFQFVPSTWRQYGQGGSPFDPVAATDAAARLAADNKAALQNGLGRPVTDAELYLAHQQGAGGALKLLQNPNARAGDVVGDRAVISNGGNPNMTAGQFASMWINKYNQGAGTSVGNFGLSGGRPGGPGVAMPAAANGAPQQAPTPTGPYGALLPVTAPSAPAQAAAPAPAPPQLALDQGRSAATTPVPPPVKPPAQPLATPATSAAAPAAAPPQPQGGLTLMKPGMSLEQQAMARGMGEEAVKQYTAARDGFQQAQAAQQNLMQLNKTLSATPEGGDKGMLGGLLAPGTGAATRLGLAKGINTVMSQFGLSPALDPAKIAAAEESQKITGRLGFDLSRSMGSREAAQVVHQAIALNPGIENTPEGARVIMGSLNAAMQRQKDFYTFQNDYMKQNGGSPIGAEIAFDKQHPVMNYVHDAESLAKVPQGAIDYLTQHANDEAIVSAFDQKYGSGLSRYYGASAQ